MREKAVEMWLNVPGVKVNVEVSRAFEFDSFVKPVTDKATMSVNQ